MCSLRSDGSRIIWEAAQARWLIFASGSGMMYGETDSISQPYPTTKKEWTYDDFSTDVLVFESLPIECRGTKRTFVLCFFFQLRCTNNEWHIDFVIPHILTYRGLEYSISKASPWKTKNRYASLESYFFPSEARLQAEADPRLVPPKVSLAATPRKQKKKCF